MTQIKTQGTRVEDDKLPKNPGEYSLIHFQNGEEMWMGHPPKEGMRPGTFIKNSVIIHEDETITVEPLITYNANYPELPQWRGHLIRGVWVEEC